MSYEAKVLADSLSPDSVRLTTMQITFPRIVLAEFNTHRTLSRNSASSRAIPVEKRCDAVRADPFMPAAFAKNQRGMQAGSDLDGEEASIARETWLAAAKSAEYHARLLANAGVHKQWANRLIEPFSWHTVICTATDWRNFFALRCSSMAQPEIRTVAEMMRDAMAASKPRAIGFGQWHLPLVDEALDADVLPEDLPKLSVARCARVSYLTHEGKRDIAADLALADRLARDGHISPFEHAARPATFDDVCRETDRLGVEYHFEVDMQKFRFGNLRGWCSLRWTMPGEAVFGGGEP